MTVGWKGRWGCCRPKLGGEIPFFPYVNRQPVELTCDGPSSPDCTPKWHTHTVNRLVKVTQMYIIMKLAGHVHHMFVSQD